MTLPGEPKPPKRSGLAARPLIEFEVRIALSFREPLERASRRPLRKAIRFQTIRSTHCARDGPGSKGSPKYWVSRATFPSRNSMMLTV